MTTSSPGFHLVTPGPADQTLLKFTPAAMTRTITPNAPGSGSSISSSWKASFGSPSRSWRITQAAIVSGSSPGSRSSFETSDTSTATLLLSGSDRDGTARILTTQDCLQPRWMDSGAYIAEIHP